MDDYLLNIHILTQSEIIVRPAPVVEWEEHIAHEQQIDCLFRFRMRVQDYDYYNNQVQIKFMMSNSCFCHFFAD